MYYFIDSTLLNSQLIVLNKRGLGFSKLKQNTNIRVVVKSGDNFYSFDDCHIDNTEDRRLRIPLPIVNWIKENFPVSVAFFAANADKKAPGVWKQDDINAFQRALQFPEHNKMDIPAETLDITLKQDKNGVNYLLIQEGFKITCENAELYLSAKALCSVLPYIISSVQNTSLKTGISKGSKACIIDQTTKWLPVSKYTATSFNHPGIYILRRKCDDGQYSYYIGKATNIKTRVISNGGKLSHPDEKELDDKQYDAIACISIRFDDILSVYDCLTENNKTKKLNPPVSKGSQVDYALYSIEDIAIHVAAMIMLSEGKRLDNKQYRKYTSEQIAQF